MKYILTICTFDNSHIIYVQSYKKKPITSSYRIIRKYLQKFYGLEQFRFTLIKTIDTDINTQYNVFVDKKDIPENQLYHFKVEIKKLYNNELD